MLEKSLEQYYYTRDNQTQLSIFKKKRKEKNNPLFSGTSIIDARLH